LESFAASFLKTWPSTLRHDAHAVKGKVTVFDFYADWCASCRKVDGHVFKKLAAKDSNVAYRKLNVMTWETPVALRYIQDVPALPYLVIYSADGKKLKALHGADLAALDAAIAEGAARK
jgi:thiol-disulfide isomerase/thioredoxin